MSDEPITETIQTPDGAVSITTSKMEPVPQRIASASPEEIAEFKERSVQAALFVAAYLPGVEEPSLKDFDKAFHLWQREEKQRFSAAQVVDMLGARLGEALIEDFDMEWVVVDDEYGVDDAVRARKYEAMAFPFSSVAKRIESDEHDFMAGVHHAMRATLDNSQFKTR